MLTIGQVETFLQAQLGAQDVALCASNAESGGEEPIRPDITIGDVLERDPRIVVRAVLAPAGSHEPAGGPVPTGSADGPLDQRAPWDVPRPAAPPLRSPREIPAPFKPRQEHADLLVREIDRLERLRTRPFVWIGYLIKQRIPAMLGCDARSARVLIAQLQKDDLIHTSQVPNPKNPSFPATEVRLNRAHPEVRRVLGTGAQDAGAEASPEPKPPESGQGETGDPPPAPIEVPAQEPQ